MPSPAASGAHWFTAAPPVLWAKAGVASSIAASDRKTYCNVRIVGCSILPKFAASGWLALTVLAPSRSAALLHTAKRERISAEKLAPAIPGLARSRAKP